MLAGDYNVIPTDLDVYNPDRWRDDALFLPEVREAFHELVAQGWTDALRTLHPKERIYTYWDYFRNAWGRNAGLRIDHLLLSPSAAKRLAVVACMDTRHNVERVLGLKHGDAKIIRNAGNVVDDGTLRSLIVAVLISSGVPQRDRADVEQEILLGAWRSVKAGRYRPDPRAEPRAAMRAWLYGICWRKTGHYLNSAWVRRAVLHAQPLGRLREPVGTDLHAQIEARDVLRALADLPDWQREALLSVDEPSSLVQYAKARGMSPGTAASRLRIAREALALRLKRWRR